MALAELLGLVVAIIVTIGAYSVTYIGYKSGIQPIKRPLKGNVTVVRERPPPKDVHLKSMDQGEFYFEFDKIFTLKMKSKSSARLFQIGMLAVLFAVAFLIITYGLRNLGF